VRAVSPATNMADREYVTSLISNSTGSGATFPVDRIAAVVDGRYVNTASTDIRGIDLTLGYTAKRGPDSFSLDANATYLLAWRQRTTPTSSHDRAAQSLRATGRCSGPRERQLAAWRD
jgi:iron complex outermembrane receptor protein